MCLQCCAKTIDYGEFAPGWRLVKATVTVEGEMDEGDWGLVRINDPDVIIKTSLKLPENEDEQVKLFNEFSEQLYLRAGAGHNLYIALKQVTYPFSVKRIWLKNELCYSFESRLYLYLAWWAQRNKPQ